MVKNRDIARLKSMTLHQFRNIDSTRLEPGEGINILSGQNAQGKTSCLEAIALLSTGRLLRTSKDSIAIKAGCTQATVHGIIQANGATIGVQLTAGQRKRIELNGIKLARGSDIIGRLPLISFSCFDLTIVTGDASERRQFLDSELAQIFPSYLRDLTIYKRALEQRNALLKQAQTGIVQSETFDPWNQQMAKHGHAMRIARSRWIAEMNPIASEFHRSLASDEVLKLSILQKGNSETAEDFLLMLQSSVSQDIARGSTSAGPHRDDVLIEVNNQEARHFGSQGQQRTAIIALKLAVLTSATEHLDQIPILLLDDVFSDLDKSRRSLLMETAIRFGGQVFITCTEAEQAGVDLLDTAKVFRVHSGRITAVEESLKHPSSVD